VLFYVVKKFVSLSIKSRVSNAHASFMINLSKTHRKPVPR